MKCIIQLVLAFTFLSACSAQSEEKSVESDKASDPESIEISSDAYSVSEGKVLMVGVDSWSDYDIDANVALFYSSIGENEEVINILRGYCLEHQIKLVRFVDQSEQMVHLTDNLWFDLSKELTFNKAGMILLKNGDVHEVISPGQLNEELKAFFE